MGKPFGYPQLPMILRGQAHAHPLAEIRRTAADVDRHVQDLAGADAHQLALGVFQLVMQAAQYAFL